MQTWTIRAQQLLLQQIASSRQWTLRARPPMDSLRLLQGHQLPLQPMLPRRQLVMSTPQRQQMLH